MSAHVLAGGILYEFTTEASLRLAVLSCGCTHVSTAEEHGFEVPQWVGSPEQCSRYLYLLGAGDMSSAYSAKMLR